MSKILALANQKGGVGKTTLSVHFAMALAETGKKVLFVDLDPQGNGTRFLTSQELTEEPEKGEGFTRSLDLFRSEGFVFSPYKARPNIDLLWAKKNDRELNDMGEVELEHCLVPANNIRRIAPRYDWVIIDTPPTLNKLQLSALIASTHVVCPVKLSGFGLDGMEGLIGSIRDVQENVNPDLKLVGVILNQAASRSKNYADDVDQLKNMLGDLIFENSIVSRRPIDDACSMSKPVWKMYTGAARPAGKEIIAVVKELVKRVNATGE